jgi:hypothetical protein
MGTDGTAAERYARTVFQDFVKGGARRLPLPGVGATWSRFETLAAVSGRDLSGGRLAEGHADAVAVLAEAGRSPVDGAMYGVWAARREGGAVVARSVGGGWTLDGIQEFCSGCSSLDRALLAADGPGGRLLFDVEIAEVAVRRHCDSWPAIGMAGSDSGSLTISGVVPGTGLVAGPGFYTERRGFWWGAVGVAACWWGGARALVAGLVHTLGPDPDPHVAAALGRAVAAVDAGEAGLRLEAGRIDEEAAGRGVRLSRRHRALSTRQNVHDRCREVLGHVADAGGARVVCLDPLQARRTADLPVYLSQHHGGRDAADLGRLVLETPGQAAVPGWTRQSAGADLGSP